MAVAVFALGENVALPGPETLVQRPVPKTGTALKTKLSPHILPPEPAFDSGHGRVVAFNLTGED